MENKPGRRMAAQGWGNAMIRIALVDNEARETERLTSLLEKYGEETKTHFQISAYENGILFLESCRMNRFDLVFMDVDMPDMDGFQTAKKFRAADPTAVLVFVTNIAQQAIRGYEVNALDYILKPLTYEALFLKLPKALALCQRNVGSRITVRTRTGQTVFAAASVLYVVSDGHHITYYTEQGEVNAYGTMKDVEVLLPEPQFYRCNSGYIVNLGYVVKYENMTLKLANGISLEISRARKKGFMEAMQRFFFAGGNQP